MVLQNVTPRHVRRFLHFLRREGLSSTIERTRLWLQTTGRGQARSILPEVSAAAPGAGTLALFDAGVDIRSFWRESAEKRAFSIVPPVLRRRRKVAMIGDLNLPQCRKYRVEQLAEVMGEAGADYVFSHYEDLPRCMDIMQDATHLFLYRLRSHPNVTRHLYEARRLRLPVLYDIDDPLFSVPAYATYGNMKALPADLKEHFLKEAPFYADIMNMADVITVSTPALRDHAEGFTARPVLLRRNFADTATLAARRPGHSPVGDGLRLCFASGSHGHEIDFAEIADDLSRFFETDRTATLVILGHFDRKHLPVALQGRIESHPFTGYADYLGHLGSCDVAVMPLADDLFNRCKSAVRVIDAASVGVPSLVGTVSDMQAMVEDGTTGRVLAPGADWAEALARLSADRAACAEMGLAARLGLERDWSARTTLPVVDPEMIRWVMA